MMQIKVGLTAKHWQTLNANEMLALTNFQRNVPQEKNDYMTRSCTTFILQ
jgi:hypothetical protein